MDRLYSWSARRAGGRITVTHSCGKVPNVDRIELRGADLVAVQASAAASGSPPGREFLLHVPTAVPARELSETEKSLRVYAAVRRLEGEYREAGEDSKAVVLNAAFRGVHDETAARLYDLLRR